MTTNRFTDMMYSALVVPKDALIVRRSNLVKDGKELSRDDAEMFCRYDAALDYLRRRAIRGGR